LLIFLLVAASIFDLGRENYWSWIIIYIPCILISAKSISTYSESNMFLHHEDMDTHKKHQNITGIISCVGSVCLLAFGFYTMLVDDLSGEAEYTSTFSIVLGFIYMLNGAENIVRWYVHVVDDRSRVPTTEPVGDIVVIRNKDGTVTRKRSKKGLGIETTVKTSKAVDADAKETEAPGNKVSRQSLANHPARVCVCASFVHTCMCCSHVHV